MSPQTPTAEGTELSLKSIFAKKEFSECLLSNTEEEVARLHFQVAHHSPTGAQAAPSSVRPSVHRAVRAQVDTSSHCRHHPQAKCYRVKEKRPHQIRDKLKAYYICPFPLLET